MNEIKENIEMCGKRVYTAAFFFFCLLFLQFPGFSKNNSPQNFLIVIAHPNTESFNHSVLKVVKDRLEEKGHLVRVRDLYQLDFQPVLTLNELKNYETQDLPVSGDVSTEQKEIQWANNIIFIYPTWWWSPPAILKGYFDRVFTPVFAFEVDVEKIRGKLAGKKVTILQTTGAEEGFIVENKLDEAVKKLLGLGLFEFVGMEVLHHEFYEVSTKSYSELKAILEEVDSLISGLF